MIARDHFREKIENSLQNNPVTAIVGSRQSGKTTLAREITKKLSRQHIDVYYFDLEYIEDLVKLDNPQRALEPLSGLVVIDEVQRKPDLFPLLRVLSDRRPLPAKFLVLGSASGSLLKQTSESLAGRIEYIELSGFGIDEIEPSLFDQLWLRGGYPSSFLGKDEIQSFHWRENFIQTFLEKDVGLFGIMTPPMQLWRFWQMAAHYHGQVWNHSELAGSLGISRKTVHQYLELLTDTFMIRQLHPFFKNVGKSLVKSPKIYIRDSGLFHTLLRIQSMNDLRNHPKLGASWEGFAIENIIRLSGHHRFDTAFWATHSRAEIDLVINMGSQLWGFEVKYTDAPSRTKSMTIASQDLKLDRLYIVYPGKQAYFMDDIIQAIPLSDVHQVFNSIDVR